MLWGSQMKSPQVQIMQVHRQNASLFLGQAYKLVR